MIEETKFSEIYENAIKYAFEKTEDFHNALEQIRWKCLDCWCKHYEIYKKRFLKYFREFVREQLNNLIKDGFDVDSDPYPFVLKYYEDFFD